MNHPRRGPRPGQFMALSADKTHLVNTFSNKPVYINGEDAFDLAVQLSSNSDIDAYLADRASRGINLIWVALGDNAYHDPKGSQKNALGRAPWGENANFTNENPSYWAHVDDVVRRAGAYGITVLAGRHSQAPLADAPKAAVIARTSRAPRMP